MRDTSETIIDFYEGAYGHTIRIDVQKEPWLISLRESIARLLRNDVENIEIGLMENVQISGIASFTLAKTEKLVNPCIFSKNDEEDSVSIVWLQDNDQLIILIGLINALIDHGKPGHQYLTNAEKEILVELAYKE